MMPLVYLMTMPSYVQYNGAANHVAPCNVAANIGGKIWEIRFWCLVCVSFMHRVHRVHSIMRVKLVWLVRVGGARPPPFTTITITSKVTLQLSGQIKTLTVFHLYQYMYSVVL
jgi:hypothetical protein